ncbi:MAG: glutamine synthetase III [Oscillospiraceae bacterium]|nr:glutamine synthetase III [Oscillospiraceae bacterium]
MITEFSKYVFTEDTMKQYLDNEVFNEFQNICNEGKELTADIADKVADAMKNWAMEHNATHYTHWFVPLTGLSAGKHEAFLSEVKQGNPIYAFSGNMLIKGESDASSLPSGGLRATFEARGYTAWDPTSPAFLLGTTLYIPTSYYSYHGEALDQKTPLLRSMQSLNKQATRLLHILGEKEVKNVKATVGAEQEYFLIDRDYYRKRLDIMVCGRTLFGAKPSKTQELEDHFYSRIRTRVMKFMDDLDTTLWSLGVPSKTRHNETAPSQYEVAAIFSVANVALDHNQLVMQVIRNVARQHNFGCLLHEKPFEGVNGSGKHNNWSLATDSGENLLTPGDKPAENIRFLLLLSAIIRAVDKYSDLVRLSACSLGNDVRLGGNEAPPTIISIFLGENLTKILEDISCGTKTADSFRSNLFTGVANLPSLELDDADRNRTSPFAFTGNKFEFRMVGSSQSIGFPNTVLNTIIADSIRYISDNIEKADDIETAAKEVIGTIYQKHSRIIFNGDNYSAEWQTEAARRGLDNLTSATQVYDRLLSEKNVELFKSMQVLSEIELRARQEIMLTNYTSLALIEAVTMDEMVARGILPACISYIGELARDEASLTSLDFHLPVTIKLISHLTSIIGGIDSSLETLSEAIQKVNEESDIQIKATLCTTLIAPTMQTIRSCCDKAEQILPSKLWPFPTYLDMFYKQ